MANWSNPALTSTYTNFLSELKARDEDLAKQFDGQTVSNLPTGTIRWNSTSNKWEKWSGTAWADLSTTYALTAVTATTVTATGAISGASVAVTGAASAGSASITGDISLSGGADRLVNVTTSHSLVFGTNNTERARILANGTILKGYTASAIDTFTDSNFVSTQSCGFQNHATQPGTSSFGSAVWSTSAGAKAAFVLARSKSGTIGTRGLVSVGDVIGALDFLGDDGAAFKAAATIISFVDGTAAANSMPGRVAIYTTASSSTVPAEQLRATSDGVIAYRQAAPINRNTTTTLTVADLKNGIILSAPTANITLTMPTGTDLEAAFNSPYNSIAFQWSVVNQNSGVSVFVSGGTNSLVYGLGTVGANTSGRFVTRRSSSGVFHTYRIA